MVSKNIVKGPKAQVDVSVTVPWSDLAPKWDANLQKMSQDVELPGFRKGTAPLPMVEQHLGQKVNDEFLKGVMPQALIEALTGTDVVPIDYPQYQVVSFQKGSDLQFTAKITERPVIKVGDYKTIKVSRPAMKTVTDTEVDKIVNDLFTRWRMRNAQSGNSQTPIPQTPPQQNGASGSMSFGATSAPQASPAGTNDVLDDNFAKAVGATSLADLKTKIRTDLEAEDKYNNELDYEEAILQEVEKITSVDLPEVLIQDELNRMMLSLQRNVSDRGMLLDEYLKTQNKTVDQIKEEWRPQAEKNVRMELGLSEIARNENVNIDDSELQAEIDKIQDAKVKAQFASEEPKMHLRHALRQTKTLNLLKSLVS